MESGNPMVPGSATLIMVLVQAAVLVLMLGAAVLLILNRKRFTAVEIMVHAVLILLLPALGALISLVWTLARRREQPSAALGQGALRSP